MKRSRAFTLIELLVVVAIIALLIALIMPQLSKAKEHARKTLCLAHLKQIGTAFYSYGGNNSGMVPDGGILAFHYDPATKQVTIDTAGTGNWQVSWPEELYADGDVLQNYRINGGSPVTYSSNWIGGRGVFYCPSAQFNNPGGVGNQNQGGGQAGYGMGYYAGSIWYKNWSGNQTPPIPFEGYSSGGKFIKPYTMKVHLWRPNGIVCVESDNAFNRSIGGGGADDFSRIDPTTKTWVPDSGRYGVYTVRHMGGANYLLGDGHAEWSNAWNAPDVPKASPRVFSKHPEANWAEFTPKQPRDHSVWGHNPNGINGNADR